MFSVKFASKFARVVGEATRYALGFVRLVPIAEGGAYAVACDGRRAVVVPVEGECDAPALVPPEVIRPTGRRPCEVFSDDGKRAFAPGKGRYAELGDGKWPKIRDVCPRPVQPLAISFNPWMLAELAEAMGDADSVTIIVDADPDKAAKGGVAVGPISVLPGSNAEQAGFSVLMPLAINDKRNVQVDELVEKLRERIDAFAQAEAAADEWVKEQERLAAEKEAENAGENADAKTLEFAA